MKGDFTVTFITIIVILAFKVFFLTRELRLEAKLSNKLLALCIHKDIELTAIRLELDFEFVVIYKSGKGTIKITTLDGEERELDCISYLNDREGSLKRIMENVQ